MLHQFYLRGAHSIPSMFCPHLSPSWSKCCCWGLVIWLLGRTAVFFHLQPACSRAGSATDTESGAQSGPWSGPLFDWSFAVNQTEARTQTSLATSFHLSNDTLLREKWNAWFQPVELSWGVFFLNYGVCSTVIQQGAVLSQATPCLWSLWRCRKPHFCSLSK